MTFYLDSRLLGFFLVCIYEMSIIRYQLILLIDMKQHLNAAIGSMSVQLYLSGLKMHQLTFNVI